MIKQLGFVLDVNRCLGCGACAKACQTYNRLPSGLRLRTVRTVEKHSDTCISRFNLSTSCNHCAHPECLRVCPSGAYTKRRDGIVLHTPEKCTNCKSCIASCPFSAPQIHPEHNKVTKCQLCHQRLEQGKTPYCIEACLTGALQLREIQKVRLDELLRLTAPIPSLRLTRPSVFYYQPRPTQLK